MEQPFWKTVWQFLTKLNILLPYNPAITLLDVYPKELKTFVYQKKKKTKKTNKKTNLHKDFYSSFIHNCQNLEANKMSFSR